MSSLDLSGTAAFFPTSVWKAGAWTQASQRRQESGGRGLRWPEGQAGDQLCYPPPPPAGPQLLSDLGHARNTAWACCRHQIPDEGKQHLVYSAQGLCQVPPASSLTSTGPAGLFYGTHRTPSFCQASLVLRKGPPWSPPPALAASVHTGTRAPGRGSCLGTALQGKQQLQNDARPRVAPWP